MPAKKKNKDRTAELEDTATDEEDLITFSMVRELLITQERLLKAHYQELFNITNSRIDGLTKKIDDLKSSLEYTQKEINDRQVQEKDDNTTSTSPSATKCIADIEKELLHLKEKCVYLENQSRRNNLRIDGIPETSRETWEETEKKVKETLEEQLDLKEEPVIERAHRVGRPSSPGMGRTIVRKLMSWKEKEDILRTARKIKPPGLFVNEDFAAETVRKRKELLPDLKRAKDQGKIAYFILDKLVVKDPGNSKARS